MLGNRDVWRRMSAVSAARSDLFNAFPALGGGCLLTSEAPATFFWALCLVLAIGAAAFDAWCRGGRKEFAARCEEDEDEVLSGGASRSMCLGRSNGYSSLELWHIRLPTRRFMAPPLRPARGSRRRFVRPFPPLDSRHALAIRADRNVQKTRGTRASVVRGFDGWDKTLKA